MSLVEMKTAASNVKKIRPVKISEMFTMAQTTPIQFTQPKWRYRGNRAGKKVKDRLNQPRKITSIVTHHRLPRRSSYVNEDLQQNINYYTA